MCRNGSFPNSSASPNYTPKLQANVNKVLRCISAFSTAQASSRRNINTCALVTFEIGSSLPALVSNKETRRQIACAVDLRSRNRLHRNRDDATNLRLGRKALIARYAWKAANTVIPVASLFSVSAPAPPGQSENAAVCTDSPQFSGSDLDAASCTGRGTCQWMKRPIIVIIISTGRDRYDLQI